MSASALLLLTARPGCAGALTGTLAGSTPGSASRSLGADFLDGTRHGAALAGQTIYDALLRLPAFGQRESAYLAECLRSFGALVDPKRSAAMVGHERLRLPGAGPVQVVMAWRRPAAMTMQEAQNWWHDRHGALVRTRGSRLGYRQLHADAAASAQLSRQLGFVQDLYDGAVLTHGDSLDGLTATFSHPDVGGAALADERNFIDHRRSTLQAFLPCERSPG